MKEETERKEEEEENRRLIEMREKLKTRSAKIVRRISSTDSTAEPELPEQNTDAEPEHAKTLEPEIETEKSEEIQKPEIQPDVTKDSVPEVVEQEQEPEPTPEADTAPKLEPESDEPQPEVAETTEETTEGEGVEDQKEPIEAEAEIERPDVSADVSGDPGSAVEQPEEESHEGQLSPVTVADVPSTVETDSLPISGQETEAVPIAVPEPEAVSGVEPPEMLPMSTQTEEEEPIPPVETECRETQVNQFFLVKLIL